MKASVLADVVGIAQAKGLTLVLAGATALAGHGVTRATGDVDLLCADLDALRPDVWAALPGATLRVGDPGDPLDAVVRVQRARQQPVDVFVLLRGWTRAVVARAVAGPRVTLRGVALPVVGAADLILLKLYAGGPRDLLDVRALLSVSPPSVPAAVDARLPDLPDEAQALWPTLRP